MDLYTNIVEYEEQHATTLNVKTLLTDLVDDYLQQRATLTPAQKSELAALRGKIITGLNQF